MLLLHQVMLGWLTEDGSIHERVVTRRIAATLSPAAFLASVDAPAAALLLAKRIVLEAARTGGSRDRAAAAELRSAIGALPCSQRLAVQRVPSSAG